MASRSKKKKYRLKMKSIDFISPVDKPAQETATVALIKSADPEIPDMRIVCKATGTDAMGIVFGYALTSTQKGEEYFDLHGDNVESGDSLIEVALAFVENGARSDEMHDCQASGTVPFVFPMTADTRKGLGLTGGEDGLIIGMKPPPDVFAKFVSGEYTGFSIFGSGERVEVAEKSEAADVLKRVQMTNSVNGHSHLIYDDATEGGCTSYSKSDGQEYSHEHPWIRKDDGSIVVGESEGHTHKLVSVAAKSAPTPALPATALPLAASNATPDPVLRPVGKEVQREDNAPIGASNEDAMSEQALKNATDRIAALEAEIATSKSLAALNDAEKAHYAGLDAVEKSAFLALGKTARAEQVTKAADADPVVFKSADGTEYRKSVGDHVVALAKRADESDKKAAEALAKSEAVELRKRADEMLGEMPDADGGRCALLKAAESIADEAARKGALAALKAGNEAMKMAFTRVGFTAKAADGSPQARLDAMADEIAKTEKVSKSVALAKAALTPAGSVLYTEIQAAKRAAPTA